MDDTASWDRFIDAIHRARVPASMACSTDIKLPQYHGESEMRIWPAGYRVGDCDLVFRHRRDVEAFMAYYRHKDNYDAKLESVIRHVSDQVFPAVPVGDASSTKAEKPEASQNSHLAVQQAILDRIAKDNTTCALKVCVEHRHRTAKTAVVIALVDFAKTGGHFDAPTELGPLYCTRREQVDAFLEAYMATGRFKAHDAIKLHLACSDAFTRSNVPLTHAVPTASSSAVIAPLPFMVAAPDAASTTAASSASSSSSPSLFPTHLIVRDRGAIVCEHGTHVLADDAEVHANDCIITGRNARVYGSNCLVAGDNAMVYGSNNRVTGANCMLLGANNVHADPSLLGAPRAPPPPPPRRHEGGGLPVARWGGPASSSYRMDRLYVSPPDDVDLLSRPVAFPEFAHRPPPPPAPLAAATPKGVVVPLPPEVRAAAAAAEAAAKARAAASNTELIRAAAVWEDYNKSMSSSSRAPPLPLAKPIEYKSSAALASASASAPASSSSSAPAPALAAPAPTSSSSSAKAGDLPRRLAGQSDAAFAKEVDRFMGDYTKTMPKPRPRTRSSSSAKAAASKPKPKPKPKAKAKPKAGSAAVVAAELDSMAKALLGPAESAGAAAAAPLAKPLKRPAASMDDVTYIPDDDVGGAGVRVAKASSVGAASSADVDSNSSNGRASGGGGGGSRKAHRQSVIMEDECVICHDAVPRRVFMPCGHVCTCQECWRKYVFQHENGAKLNCFLCNANVEQTAGCLCNDTSKIEACLQKCFERYDVVAHCHMAD